MSNRVFMKGTEAVAEAAVRAGCRFFAGYPITPQNEVPEYLARRLPDVGGFFVQGESEVASANMLYGGAANCYVVISDRPVGAAKFSKTNNLIAMSASALDTYLDSLQTGGCLFVNSDIAGHAVKRDDIEIVYIDAMKIAQTAGAPRSANLVMLGAFVEKTGALCPDDLIQVMKHKFKKASPQAMEANIRAFEAGRKSARG